MRNNFYLGLLDTDNSRKVKLFEKALSDTNEYIRRSAAEELAILMARGNELPFGTEEHVRREAHGFWAAAFDVTDNKMDKEKVLSFLLGYELNTASFHEARRYVLKECENHDIFFSETETAVIEGHHAVSSLRYIDGLNFFRALQTETRNGNRRTLSWPEQIPELLIFYPNLINTLGRAFQNTQSGREGIELFLKWERNLTTADSALALKDHRYKLLYSAGRIARARAQPDAASIFERALHLVPNREQSDVCIWNILDVSSNDDVFYARLEQYIPVWHRDNFYNDVMQRYLQRLCAAQNWNKIISTFNLLKDTEANILKAAFSWLIVRAIEEDLLSEADKKLAASVINSETADPFVFARIAYNASGAISTPSLYYRMRSSEALGLPFMKYVNIPIIREKYSQKLEFILGFFENDAAALANPYIRSIERGMSPAELHVIGEAYDKLGMHAQAMRMIALYISDPAYTIKRRDLEIMFPRPFLELTEQNAKEFNIEPSLLFALIRTESAFQPAVLSRVGATGLMQLMPATAREVAGRIRNAGGPDYTTGTPDMTDPALNLYFGSFYYDYLMSLFDNDLYALMAYNGGMGRVRRWSNANRRLPPDLVMETANVYETRDYGKRVTGVGAVYRELYY